jgi:hypothetical protein
VSLDTGFFLSGLNTRRYNARISSDQQHLSYAGKLSGRKGVKIYPGSKTAAVKSYLMPSRRLSFLLVNPDTLTEIVEYGDLHIGNFRQTVPDIC